MQHGLIGDLMLPTQEYAPGEHLLGAHYLRGGPLMMFNLTSYIRTLTAEFRAAGGQIHIEELHEPAELARIHEKTLINATGYGARALFDDRSLIPVHGQLAGAVPQPRIDYGLLYRDSVFVPRRDGFVFQVIGDNDDYGFDDERTIADRAQAQHAVGTIGGLFAAVS